MLQITRRHAWAAAAAATVAATLRPGKLAAQELQGIEALHALPQPRKLDLHWQAADGTQHGLADYAGRGVVLNMWATWCVPCVREMPALDDLAKLVAGDGIVVLPVSSDHGGAPVVQRFYAEHAIHSLPVLLDPEGALPRGLGVRGIPTTLLIDKDGMEVGWLEGAADWSSADAVTVIRRAKG